MPRFPLQILWANFSKSRGNILQCSNKAGVGPLQHSTLLCGFRERRLVLFATQIPVHASLRDGQQHYGVCYRFEIRGIFLRGRVHANLRHNRGGKFVIILDIKESVNGSRGDPRRLHANPRLDWKGSIRVLL